MSPAHKTRVVDAVPFGREAPSLERTGESGYGYKETYSRTKSTSALPPKADILVAVTDFRL